MDATTKEPIEVCIVRLIDGDGGDEDLICVVPLEIYEWIVTPFPDTVINSEGWAYDLSTPEIVRESQRSTESADGMIKITLGNYANERAIFAPHCQASLVEANELNEVLQWIIAHPQYNLVGFYYGEF